MIEQPLENHGHPMWDVVAYAFIAIALLTTVLSMRD
jgi:hypothetical protein